MNCLEFRRQKLSDPHSLGPEAQQHQGECARCNAFAQDVDAAEQRLLVSLSPPVPAGLEDRVLLNVRRPAYRHAYRWAMAAGLTLAIGIGAMRWFGAQEMDYAQLAIEHVVDEPQALISTRNDDTAFFEMVLADFGGQMVAPLGRVRYAKLCPGPEGAGWHVVLDTEHGVATLMLVPGTRVKEPNAASGHGWHALVQPGGRGHLAIVTTTAQNTDAVSKLIRQRVRWDKSGLALAAVSRNNI